jgi:cytochrome c-type biogenesis protein CcmF
MAPGDTYSVAGYQFVFNGVHDIKVDNYIATRGSFEVTKEGSSFQVELLPEKRIYPVQQSPMTEAAIDPGLTRDLFVALGEPLDENGTWAVRIHYKPFVRWIWLGAIIMALGGLFAASDRRYYQRSKSTVKVDDSALGKVV